MGPPNDSVQLVQVTPISLWFMVSITIVNGVYKPSNVTGGPHIVPPTLFIGKDRSGQVSVQLSGFPWTNFTWFQLVSARSKRKTINYKGARKHDFNQ